MIKALNEENIKGKTYLFRGESDNRDQSNYSRKAKLRFNSRFFAYEIYDGICLFGNVAVYELLPSAKIWYYGEEIGDFIEEYDLADYEVPELSLAYRDATEPMTKLSDCTEYGGDIELNYHDLYHAQQIVAMAYLEDAMAGQYDGIEWYQSSDTPEYQLMIWNKNAVRKLSYKEAKQVVEYFAELYPDSAYAKDPDWAELDSDFAYDYILKKSKKTDRW